LKHMLCLSIVCVCVHMCVCFDQDRTIYLASSCVSINDIHRALEYQLVDIEYVSRAIGSKEGNG
jgi:hypothetical protein